MKRDAKAYLHDIHEAGMYILEFTETISMDEYCRSEIIKAAVERKFAIIGEALARLRENYPELVKRISGTEKIIGFRNVLIHSYDVIDDATVWSAIRSNLPTLLGEVNSLLNP